MNSGPQWMSDWYEKSLNLFNRINDPITNFSELDKESLIDYDSIHISDSLDLSVAIVKLNGGLGTSMGCSGPKSLIPIEPNGSTFLDRIVQRFEQNDHAKKLILLNSFNTSSQTTEFLDNNYPHLDWVEIYQHSFKKIDLNTGHPFQSNDLIYYNPPGHGSIYFDLYHSGQLHALVKDGVDYLFISNSDNLAATLDDKIMTYLQNSRCPFLIELTPKMTSDVKGGTIVKSGNSLRLWEIAQVESSQLDLFQRQPVFNTNNIWVSISDLIDVIESGELMLDLIKNKKKQNNIDVYQLEYAMGSAIQSFIGAKAMEVPRKRFFPVKKTSDLLLLLSDYTQWTDAGDMIWDSTKSIAVNLDSPFDTIDGFFNLFKFIPSIKEASSIFISGNINFDIKVQFFNDVVIEFNSEKTIPISTLYSTFDNVKVI